MRQMLVAGRYRLVRMVGRGGMGRIWLADDELLHREVAAKEILPPVWMGETDRDDLLARTMREARTAARLTHRNVVRIYDVVQEQGNPWLIMEYVASRSLQEILEADGPLDVRHGAELGMALLDALRAAHRAGVLHRDVKPHNVLVAEDGRLMLTDFGLATFDGDGGLTRAGMVLGSPQYVAPERVASGVSTAAGDLWSLGATLYAAVEGHSPYARSTPLATLAALATEPPDLATHAGPLTAVLAGLLRRDPRQRLTAADAERLLRQILDQLSTGSPTPPPNAFDRESFGRNELRRNAFGRYPPGDGVVRDAEAAGGAFRAADTNRAADTDRVDDRVPRSTAEEPWRVGGRAAPSLDAGAGARGGAAAGPDGGAGEGGGAGADTGRRRVRRPRLRHPLPAVLAALGLTVAGFVVVAVQRQPPHRPAVVTTTGAVDVGVDPYQRGGAAGETGPGLPGRVGPPGPQPGGGRPPPAGPPSFGCSPPPPPHERVTTAAVPPGARVLPPGWAWHTDGAGFRVAAPAGWEYFAGDQVLCFHEPFGPRVLIVDPSPPTADTADYWRLRERQLRDDSRISGYELVATRQLRRHRGAEWEFSWTGPDGRRQRTVEMLVAAGPFAVVWHTEELDWQQNQANLDLVRETFDVVE